MGFAPAEFECVRCRSKSDDCEACDGEGIFRLNQCPAKYVDPWVWEIFFFARQAREFGAWPVGGGILDQSRWAMDAFREVWASEGA